MMLTTQECRIGDVLNLSRDIPDERIDTIVTSPPYWGLRDYGVRGQIGLEATLEEYHERLLEVTAECMRVLKPTGVMFWNHGDSYEDKLLDMQNERLIIKMIDNQGWILRNRIIWNKPNGMPSSVTDRFSNKYEPVYMLVKSKKYWFDLDAVRVPFKDASEVQYRKKLRANKEYDVKEPYKTNTPYKHNAARITSQESPNRMWGDTESLERQMAAGKNPGDVWTIPTQPYSESHFATFPTALIEPMIKAACPAEICPVCGTARDRIVDSEFVPQQDVSLERGIKGAKGQKPMDKSNHWDGVPRGTTTHHTVGWTSCDCNAGWIAGTVLDPFCGSGTVLEVCRRLNLNALGLELNPNYEPLIRERSMAHTPPLTAY